MEVLVLASGSSGNALLVRGGGVAVLFDVGISAFQIRHRLAAFGIDERAITAIVVSHEHSDHVRGLDVLGRRLLVPAWASSGTWSRVEARVAERCELCSGRATTLGDLSITPVATSHDAVEPVALVIDDGRRRLAVCTDTGVMTPLLMQRLAGVDLLLLEANHDADMLRRGPYPWPLKQRIASRLGHLGNHQTTAAIPDLASPRLRAVIGLHLSGENNCPQLVREILADVVPTGVVTDAVPRDGMLRVSLDLTLDLEHREIPPAQRRRAAAG